MNKQTLEKVVTTTHLGAQDDSQLLDPQQVDAFLGYLWERSVLLEECRRIQMVSNDVEISRLAIGQRLVRRATEAVDDHVNAQAKFGKISLTTQKLRLDWELSTESFEDSVQGASLEDQIARLMAYQMANDLEDLAINGDSTSTDPLMSAFDGWRKTVETHGSVIDASANGLNIGEGGMTRDVFNAALKAMDRFYMQRRNELRFYVGSNVAADYVNSLVAIEDYTRDVMEGRPTGPQGAVGQSLTFPAFGVSVKEVPYLPENMNAAGTAIAGSGEDQYGTVELTFPQNRIWGIKRAIQVYREFVPKKDTVEYTVFTRVGAQVEDPDAYIIVNGIKIL